jgi:hypothetical protein
VRLEAHDLVVRVAVALVGIQSATLPKDHRAPGQASQIACRDNRELSDVLAGRGDLPNEVGPSSTDANMSLHAPYRPNVAG